MHSSRVRVRGKSLCREHGHIRFSQNEPHVAELLLPGLCLSSGMGPTLQTHILDEDVLVRDRLAPQPSQDIYSSFDEETQGFD